MTDTIKRSLRYDFTAVEIHDLSMQLANKTKEHSALTEEKKSVVSQFSAKLNEIKATANKLSNQVSDGWEFREVDCRIEYNKPEHGRKTIIRKDTDKVVVIETMTDYDHNLFTQEGIEDDLLEDGVKKEEWKDVPGDEPAKDGKKKSKKK